MGNCYNNKDSEDEKNEINDLKREEEQYFHYLKLTPDLKQNLNLLLDKEKENHNISLCESYKYERQDIQKKNKNIYLKIRKQAENAEKYKGSENYLAKKAKFFKDIGSLVRYSHEIAIFMLQELFKKFKKNNNDLPKTRKIFAKWIKYNFNRNNNDDCFSKIVENNIIKDKIKSLLEDDDETFYLSLFPELIELYFYCYLVDIKVKIVYGKEGEKFNWDTMIDLLLTNQDEKMVLFTFLPGLYANGRFFENSNIYVVPYTKDNPNKFLINRPVFSEVEEKYLDKIFKEDDEDQ